MTPKKKRTLTLIFIFAIGIWLLWIGLNGWRISGLPAYYVGALFLVAAIAGALGVNIWYGGVLDPRLDDASINNKAGGAKTNEQDAPWNPYQVLGFVVIATSIFVGIALGLNWKRLKKPEWQVITILLSIIVPGLAIALALGWVSFLSTNKNVPIQLILSIPYLAMGVNFGYAWALARLQNGAYKAYQAQGAEALSNYEYDLQGAVIFGISVAIFIGLGFTLIFPLLMGR
ncbi:MAG: hypothetical protein IPP66_04310 [Anaerolineales bacterium]|nr:hypothetical protein [Anaerolineales bacterium]